MMIGEEELNRFKAAYKDEFGEELADEEALEKFMGVVNVLKIILNPDNK